MPAGFYKRSGRWGFFYRDAGGRRRYKTGYTNLEETRKLREKIRDRERQIRDGILDPVAEKLTAAARTGLLSHVADWENDLLARGNTGKHVASRVQMVKDVVAEAKLNRLGDIEPSRVQQAIFALKSKPRGLRERGFETLNRHVKACKQFGKWLQRNHRAVVNLFDPLEPYTNVDGKEWAALTDEQVIALIHTTETSSDKTRKCNIPSGDRAMMYRIAFASGFRVQEIRSLTVESFNLDRGTVTVTAAMSKRKRKDVQDLPEPLVTLLRPWLATKRKSETLFPLPHDTAKMFRRDLKRAGLPMCDEEGRRFVFHSTRETLATQLAEAGIEPNDLKAVMRHSSITLSMDTYAKVRRGRTKDAVKTLGDGALAPALQLASTIRNPLGQKETSQHAEKIERLFNENAGKAGENANFEGDSGMRLAGIEPTTVRLEGLATFLFQLIKRKKLTAFEILSAARGAALASNELGQIETKTDKLNKGGRK